MDEVDAGAQEAGATDVTTIVDHPWVIIVWNDPVNLMSYVVYVFQTYFGFSRDQATAYMNDVHERGKALVSSGSRESMERDVQAMHGYGLWATLQRSDA